MVLKRKIQKNSNNQYTITLPKALVEAMGLKPGTELEFKINSKGEIILSKAEK